MSLWILAIGLLAVFAGIGFAKGAIRAICRKSAQITANARNDLTIQRFNDST